MKRKLITGFIKKKNRKHKIQAIECSFDLKKHTTDEIVKNIMRDLRSPELKARFFYGSSWN